MRLIERWTPSTKIWTRISDLAHVYLDIECYPNFFLVSLMRGEEIFTSEMLNDQPTDYSRRLVEFLNRRIEPGDEVVTFNGNAYDIPLIERAVNNQTDTNYEIYGKSRQVIVDNVPAWKLRRRDDHWRFEFPHIDLKGAAPGFGGLKLYGARLHAETLETLPYDPHEAVSDAEASHLTKYCGNDLALTKLLHESLEEPLNLRRSLEDEMGMNLMSANDAQIGERVVMAEMRNMLGSSISKPSADPARNLRFARTESMRYWSREINELASRFVGATYSETPNGKLTLPQNFGTVKVSLGDLPIKVGIGGLHTLDTPRLERADRTNRLCELDVSSFYPRIVLEQELHPMHLGEEFLAVYGDLVRRRLKAKRNGDKTTADSLKIAINGCFGKFGSAHSYLRDPKVMLQVTISGQLLLLRLIDMLQAEDFEILSANTDGVVARYPTRRRARLEWIVSDYQAQTGMRLEETEYQEWACIDVNNYFARTAVGKIKGKGIFGSAGLMKNPHFDICARAAVRQLIGEVSVEETIAGNNRIEDYLAVRKVKDGAMWGGKSLGTVARWYVARGGSPVTYATGGRRVPLSESAKPLMRLRKGEFPRDLDKDWYARRSLDLIRKIDPQQGESLGI